MRTTININSLYFEKLKAASKVLNISRKEMISIILNRLADDSVFKPKPYETVQYQDSSPDIDWVTAHIEFNPVIYEKAQDLRRNFKFSVSWFISYAIVKYLDEIVKEISASENQRLDMDNYDNNFIYIAKMYGGIRGFITIWGVPGEKYLNKLLI